MTDISKNELDRFLDAIKPLLDAQQKVASSENQLSEKDLKLFLSGFQDSFRNHLNSLATSNPSLNIWRSIGVGSKEVRNCKALAWFIDPSGDHGQGSRFLKCLLKGTEVLRKINLEKYYRVKVEEWLDSEHRGDMVIIGEGFQIVFEAKIRSDFSSGQLDRYWNIMTQNGNRESYGFYLTVEHVARPVGSHGFLPMTWTVDIANALLEFSDGDGESRAQNELIRELSRQYRTFIINKFK